MKRKCGWCGKPMPDSAEPPAPGCEGMTSHTICPECLEKMKKAEQP